MEALRNAVSMNRSAILNVVYVAVFLLAVYWLYKFLRAGADREVSLLNVETPANEPRAYKLPVDKPEIRV
jgi:hypothetical protein